MPATIVELKPAPKDPIENIHYRAAVLRRAAVDDEFKRECWIRASRDIIWYTDTFGWTFSPKDHADCPDRPFVLWDFQEQAVLAIEESLGHHDLLLEKSRDMGASWMILLVFHWRWMFRKNQSFLVGSRKEDLVDAPGDPASLFWKLDYLLQHLPGWLVPHHTRTALHLRNDFTGSTIDGESTNEDFARGDRRTAILLDELAAIDNAFPILSAARGATKCRIGNSTPRGASGGYYEWRERLVKESPECVLRLHWSEHPERRPGLYTTDTGKPGGRLKVLDEGFQFPTFFNYILDGKLRSPWYDLECSRAANVQEIAQELDINYAGSGWSYFEDTKLAGVIQKTARNPYVCGEMVFSGTDDKPEFHRASGGRLKLWTQPTPEGDLNPRLQFAIGCDISNGGGGRTTSNSVASVVDKLTGEKVAEFAINNLRPPDFCDYVVAMAKWFNHALIIWEENGPGTEFTSRLKETGYRNIFYREEEGKFLRRKTKKPGWWTTPDNKRMLLSTYFQAVLTGRFVNRSEIALKECGEYVHTGSDIVHAKSKGTSDPTATGVNHGDRVIADALAFRALADLPLVKIEIVQEVPSNSFLGRRNEWERKQKRQELY